MRVPMMHVGIVRMSVRQWHVNVRVTVRRVAVPIGRVGMLVVLIMRMGVCVFLLLVCVQVIVMFSKVQPDAACHEQSRGDELPRHGIGLYQHR